MHALLILRPALPLSYPKKLDMPQRQLCNKETTMLSSRRSYELKEKGPRNRKGLSSILSSSRTQRTYNLTRVVRANTLT